MSASRRVKRKGKEARVKNKDKLLMSFAKKYDNFRWISKDTYTTLKLANIIRPYDNTMATILLDDFGFVHFIRTDASGSTQNWIKVTHLVDILGFVYLTGTLRKLARLPDKTKQQNIDIHTLILHNLQEAGVIHDTSN